MPQKTKSAKTSSKPVAVVISDLHAHPWAAFAQRDGSHNSRLRRTLAVLEHSLQRAEFLKVPWLFAGDIVHTAGYTLNVVLAELIAVLRRHPDVLKVGVWGNHDARGVGGRISLEQTVWAALQAAVPNLIVLDPSLQDHRETYGQRWTLAGAGAQPSMEVFRYAHESDIGLYHGTVRGSVGPNGYVFTEGLDPAELLSRHKVAIVGDIHHPQQIDAPPGQAILIPGSPEHHNFGDSGEHGYWVLSMPAAVEFIPSGSPEFRTVAHPRQVKDDGHFYRVQSMPAGTSLPANATAIAPTPTIVQSRGLLRGKQGAEVLVAWLEEEPPEPGTPRSLDYLEAGKQLLESQEQRQLRPLRLTQLHLKNFCSYADQRFDIRDGTWLVVGRGRDYPSNGAGKSTLFESLFWVLFGRTTKGLSGSEVLRRGAGECEVTAKFQQPDGDTVVVVRAKGERSQLSVYEGGALWEATSVNDMTEKLGRWLGLTPELFQALGYFSQEQLLLFASATDGERKDMLADLIGLSAYQAASSAAQSKLTGLALEEQRVSAGKDMTSRLIASEQSRLEATEARAAVWEEDRKVRATQARAVLEDFLVGLNNERDHLLAVAMEELTASLTKRRTELLEQEAVLVNQVGMTRPLATVEQLTLAREELQTATSEVVEAKTRLKQWEEYVVAAQHRLDQMGEILGEGICPTCRQAVTPDHRETCLEPERRTVDDHKRLVKGAQEDLELALKTASSKKAAVGRAEVGVRSAREADEQYQALQQTRADLRRLVEDEQAMGVSVAKSVDKVLKEKRAALIAEAARIKGERNPNTAEQAATLERIAEAQQEHAGYVQSYSRLQWTKAMYTYWQRGFSKQGIQSLLVDEVAALFNAARGTIFPALTQGVYDVQFSTMSQTKAGEWRERSEFQVFEHGEPVLYAALSGGQRRRIDVGVMLVLTKAVSEWMRVPGILGLLVLDEVFGFLDASGAEGLMEALREVQAQIPAVYAVSHDPQLQALFPSVVVVEQDAQGVSHIMEGT